MSTTSTTDTGTDPGPVPPRDYGGGDQWVEEAGADYFVQPPLRHFYATAEPSEAERAGYVRNGQDAQMPRAREFHRVVSPGTPDRDPVVVTETETVMCLVHLEGASGYRQWLHRKRLEIAANRQHRADQQQAFEDTRRAWSLTCTVCGRRDPSTLRERVNGGAESMTVTGCPAHLTILVETARTALAARAADQRTEDGRRVGDVAAQIVADLLDRKDGAA